MARDDSTQQLERDALVGEMLGPYEVIARIAEGGMGVILAAQHSKIGRRVAIKLLRDDLVQKKEQVSRFLNEAKTVNRVGHPNIIEIYDFVEAWERQPPLVYMVMEYLVGRNLHEHVETMKCLSADETIEIAGEVCAALVAMHDVNVLHLDLKPHNVFLASGDGAVRERRVKLLDFGVSRVFAEGQRVELTDPGLLIGTPKYMSPEQILGRALDVRADIYALGLVMYKMLAGELFLHAEEVGALLVEQVHTDPPAEILDAHGRRVPRALEQVVHRCLRKAPAERYGSARELRDALRSALASQTGRVPIIGDDARDGELPRRSTVRWAGVALVAAICCVALWLGLRHSGSAKDAAAGSAVAGSSGSGADVKAKAQAKTSRRADAARALASDAGNARTTAPAPADASTRVARAKPDVTRRALTKRKPRLKVRAHVGVATKRTPTRRTPIKPTVAKRGTAAGSAREPGSAAGTAKPATGPSGAKGTRETIKRGGTLDPFGKTN